MNPLLILLGIAVLSAAWFGPLPQLATASFTAHMAMHVSVVAIAAPLIGAGLLGSKPLERHLPSWVLVPVPASLLEFVVVWGWHVPAFHHLAREHAGAFVAEQASFLVAGVLLWASALRRSTTGEDGHGTGVVALLLTSMHMILLGTLLTLATRPLYHIAASQDARTALLADQQIGGMLMLAGGGLPYLIGGLYLVWRLLQAPPQFAEIAPARSDRQGGES